jgi:predicted nucleic acid-binding protein
VNRVFVDTSAFVALRNSAEREHTAARRAFAGLVDHRTPLFTSSYVFSETYTALLVRVGRDEAIGWGRAMRAGTAIEIVPVDDEVLEAAWRLLEQHDDNHWSHVDATSFALIQREKATTAFAFDRHFKQGGLNVVPGSTG